MALSDAHTNALEARLKKRDVTIARLRELFGLLPFPLSDGSLDVADLLELAADGLDTNGYDLTAARTRERAEAIRKELK